MKKYVVVTSSPESESDVVTMKQVSATPLIIKILKKPDSNKQNSKKMVKIFINSQTLI